MDTEQTNFLVVCCTTYSALQWTLNNITIKLLQALECGKSYHPFSTSSYTAWGKGTEGPYGRGPHSWSKCGAWDSFDQRYNPCHWSYVQYTFHSQC